MNQWHHDINDMHKKYGVHDWVEGELEKGDWSRLQKFLEFRLNFLQEELDETRAAAVMDRNPSEVVDGLIDLCVIAIGTLDAFNVDAQKAWEEVHKCNMAKERGVKESRPNPLGLPDLIKPEGWQGPDHRDNHGYIPNAL
jgi:predicted HAD superfamily Cof-like phosphohydrolase